MNAGQHMDAMIATKVMGHIVDRLPRHAGAHEGDTVVWEWTPGVVGDPAELRRYSTNIYFAWMVVEHLIAAGFRYPLVRYDGDRREGSPRWTAAVSSADGKEAWRGDADSAPLAICLAALKVVGVEVPA